MHADLQGSWTRLTQDPGGTRLEDTVALNQDNFPFDLNDRDRALQSHVIGNY